MPVEKQPVLAPPPAPPAAPALAPPSSARQLPAGAGDRKATAGCQHHAARLGACGARDGAAARIAQQQDSATPEWLAGNGSGDQQQHQAGAGTSLVVRLCEAPRCAGQRDRRRIARTVVPRRCLPAQRCRGAPLRRRAPEARARRARGVRRAAAADLRARVQRHDADGGGLRRHYGPRSPRPGAAGALRPAGKRRRRARSSG